MVAPLGWLAPSLHECDGGCKQDRCARKGQHWTKTAARRGIVGALVQATNRSAAAADAPAQHCGTRRIAIPGRHVAPAQRRDTAPTASTATTADVRGR